MKKLLITLTLFVSCIAFGQQTTQFSQYMKNQYMVNPGSAGMYDFLDITIGGRMQWVGFENAPMSSYLYASSPLKKKGGRAKYNPGIRISNRATQAPKVSTGKLKHAVGGFVLADQYGAYQQIKFAGTYAIHMPLSRDYNLSLGTNIGLSNRGFIKDRAQTLNMLTGVGTDPTYDAYSASATLNTLDIGLGMYFYSQELFVGISAEQLTKDLVSFGSGTANFDPRMHFRGTAGYKFEMNRDWSATPSILVKYVQNAPVSFEGSAIFEYKNWVWFGLSYRNKDAVIAMVGLNISERFKFGYSFDYSVSRFNQYSSGGHEVVLGLMFGR
ncbi:MAG: type IX secretion system membrane protein PorP/SprF [Fluviicola sp.]|nr:type IX secretion system membrane protein PorP/SprF [Fluviicola sp.]